MKFFFSNGNFLKKVEALFIFMKKYTRNFYFLQKSLKHFNALILVRNNVDEISILLTFSAKFFQFLLFYEDLFFQFLLFLCIYLKFLFSKKSFKNISML